MANKEIVDSKMLRNNIILLIFITFIILILTIPCFGSDSKIQLTPEEKAWIDKNHTVRIRIGSAPPFMLTDGKIRGIAIDYLTNVFNRNGIKFSYVQESEVTWPQALKYIEKHDVVDMVPTAKITGERKKHMLFTNEYIVAPWVIFTRSDADFVSSIDDLKGKTVSVEEGFVIHELLKREYPEINLKVASAKLDNNFAEIPIKDLSTGLVDAYIGNLLMTTYMIQSKGYTNIKVAAPTPFDNHNQAMAIRNDWAELVSIINKTIAVMTPEEHTAIRNRWLGVRYEYGISKTYVIKWVLGIAAIASLLIGTILFWNKRLKVEINSRTKVEKTLKQLLETFELAQKMAKIGHWRYNIETQQPIWSEQMFMVLGCDPDKGVPNYEAHKKIFHPDDWEMFDKAVQGSINGIPYNTEARLIFSDGSIHWCNAQGFPHYDQDGNIVELFGTTQDITERKKTEKDLRESEEKYRSMMESMKDASYICSPELHIEYMNPAMIDRVGTNAIGKLCYKALYDMDEKCSWCVFDQIKKGEHVDYEVADPKDSHYYSVSNSPIFHADGTASKLTIFHDITKIKDIEAQLRQSRKMESIGTLAGGIAHDFNNLLYIISGNAELALEDIPEWNPAHASLEEIKSATLKAAGIAKQLLNFSRKTDQEMKPIGAVTIIKDALKFLRSTIPTTIDIQKHLPDADITILADPIQINQIMMNLCINASQAMEDTGGIMEIIVETVSLDEEAADSYPDLTAGDYLKITVNDTGPGIDPEIIERIFDPYFTTKEMGKGSGMGLSIVHGIVQNHSGAISVDSKLGKGTTFSILFPAVDEKPKIETETINKIPRGHETILFVDDEKSIANMAQKMLKHLGYKVETSLNPLQALDLFKSKPEYFDLVITDMTMPQMTGAKLSEKLIEIRFNIPVIICTGHSSLIDEEKAKQFGIAGYVMKPVSMSIIAKTIRKVLEK